MALKALRQQVFVDKMALFLQRMQLMFISLGVSYWHILKFRLFQSSTFCKLGSTAQRSIGSLHSSFLLLTSPQTSPAPALPLLRVCTRVTPNLWELEVHFIRAVDTKECEKKYVAWESCQHYFFLALGVNHDCFLVCMPAWKKKKVLN